MTLPNVPKTYNFGFGELAELSYLQQVLGISRRTAAKYLKALKIRPIYFKDEIYFSLPTWKRILFVLSKPNGRGFVAPGSTAKNNPRIRGNAEYLFEVTDEILDQAAAPEVLAEMNAAEGRDISLLKKFITPNVGRPHKKEEI